MAVKRLVWIDLVAVLYLSGYNAPYLSVYSENAVDVFDVNTTEWIQTIPLKKVLFIFNFRRVLNIKLKLTVY